MNQLQILIENIKVALAYSDTVSVDEMRIYARDYSEACVELNRRMQMCIPFLREGNVREVVRLAEQVPNIPSVYSLLDFPEREDWLEVVATLDLNEPPALLPHLCQEINDAYVSANNLEPLLRRHRIGALNNAPLQERLAILRAIAKADYENTFWRDDVEAFEKARKEELKIEVKEAVASKDLVRVQLLNNELTSQPWLTPIPQEWQQALCGVILENYANVIQRHHAAFDDTQIANVYSAMQQLLQRNKLPMPANIAQAIRPALTWMNDTHSRRELDQSFKKCVAALRMALERNGVPTALYRLYYELSDVARRAGKEIPTELAMLYHEQMEAHATSQKRRTQVTIGAIIGVCSLISIFVIWGVLKSSQDEIEKGVLARLQQIEEQQAFEELQGAIESIERDSRAVARRPQVVAEIGKLRDLQKQDEVRAQNFRREHDYFMGNVQDAQSQDLAASKKIEPTLKTLTSLARTSQEKTLANEASAAYNRLRRAKQQETDDAFRAAFTAVAEEFAPIRDTRDTPLDERLARANELLGQMSKINSLDAVSDNLKMMHAEQLKAITQFRNDAVEEQQQDVAFRAIVNNVGDWQRFHNAVASFATSATKHPAAADAKTVSQELTAIQAVATSLQRLSQDFTAQAKNFATLRNGASALAQRFTDELLTKMDAQTADQLFPFGPVLIEWAQTQSWSWTSLNASNSLFKSLTQKEVWVWVKKPSEEWYYLTSKPTSGSDYRYITAFDARDKTISLRADFSSAKDSQPQGVTQYTFAKEALAKLDQIKDNAAAVPVACEVIGDAIKSDGLDPIFKCVLLNTLIADVSKLDPSFASTYAPVAQILAASGVNFTTTTPWMNVDSTNTLTSRRRAEEALQQIRNWDELSEQAIKKQGEFQASLESRAIRFEWIGLLTYQNKACSVVLKTAKPVTGDIYVLRRSPTQSDSVTAEKIGTLEADGSVRVTANNTTQPQCLPVFVLAQ